MDLISLLRIEAPSMITFWSLAGEQKLEIGVLEELKAIFIPLIFVISDGISFTSLLHPADKKVVPPVKNTNDNFQNIDFTLE
jgi:hypothetical protein